MKADGTMLLAALFFQIATPAMADPRPSRSECIIGYTLDWSAVKTDRVHVVNSMEHPAGAQRIKPLVARSLSLDLSRMYLQFKSSCVRKQDMAEDLLKYWRSKGLDLPKMTRIPDPIIPSPDTIDVQGPSWSDGLPSDVQPEDIHSRKEQKT